MNAIAGGRRIENHARLASRLCSRSSPRWFPSLSGQIRHLGRLGCETVILTDKLLDWRAAERQIALSISTGVKQPADHAQPLLRMRGSPSRTPGRPTQDDLRRP